MNRAFLIVIAILFSQLALAQHTELSMQLSSGLFSFGGASAANSSFVLLSDTGWAALYQQPLRQAERLFVRRRGCAPAHYSFAIPFRHPGFL